MLEAIKPPLPTEALANARNLRRESTDAERRLWARLRGRQIQDLKFRRQHPIPPYVADFCCVERHLIIELDGSQHTAPLDADRTARLERDGWNVIRFWNNDVLLRTDAVPEAIIQELAGAYPHPSSTPEGKGTMESSLHPNRSGGERGPTERRR